MSRNFRFEPPTIDELENMGKSEYPCDHTCNECEYDCQEEEIMIEKITEIINMYKDVELITIPEISDEMKFELYDYLEKPANFEEDIKCILHEIKPAIPTTYTVSHEYYNDEYWNGEEMIESNLSCTITVKYDGGEL